jgi:DNA polymerase-3 subunit delta
LRIDTERLQQQLTRTLHPLYAVFGDEALLALEAGDRIRATARAAGYTEREVLVAEPGFKWSELALAGTSQSLFATRTLLEVRIPSGKPGVEGSSALQRFCGKLPPDTVTLVQLPAVDWRTQKSEWFEALDAAGLVVEARTVTRKALPQWLAGRLKAQGQQAEGETLDFIADRVEGNLMAAWQEVQKLALLFPSGRITFEQVREAVLDVSRYDVFSLGETMLEGDPLRLARMIEGLRSEGVAPPLVLWALTDEIRAIGTLLKGAAAGRPVSALVREARIRGFAHQKLIESAYRRYSLGQVHEGLRHGACIDRMVKGIAKGDVWDELLQLGLRFAQPQARREPRVSAREDASERRSRA